MFAGNAREGISVGPVRRDEQAVSSRFPEVGGSLKPPFGGRAASLGSTPGHSGHSFPDSGLEFLSIPSLWRSSEVAAGIGNSSATRAVARACAANRVALVIPCYRVIRGTGELGGYRWGLGRKRTLISGAGG